MKPNDFYKKILSIKVPVLMLGFGVWFFLYSIIIKNAETFFLTQFVYVYISLIIIAELLIAFFKIKRFLKKKKINSEKKVKFNLLVLPFLPSIIGTFVYSLIKIMEFGVLYKREFIKTLGITLFINFVFSVIYNSKIQLFDNIKDDDSEICYENNI